jgi:hypothetical protein
MGQIVCPETSVRNSHQKSPDLTRYIFCSPSLRLLIRVRLKHLIKLFYAVVAHLRLIHTYHAVPAPCRAAKCIDHVCPIRFTQCGRVWFTHAMPRPCHATSMPFWKRILKSTAQRGMGMACHVWINIGRPEAAWGQPARARLLPALARSSTKFLIRSIRIR